MAAPQITALPTPPSRADDPDLFSTRADAFLGALPQFRTEANTQADYLDSLTAAAFAAGLEDAAANAATATAGANTATAQALIATNAATQATGANEQAQIAADSAASSLAGTLAAAGLSGAKAYATLALANDDLASLTTNQVVFIADVGEYYQYNGAALVFLRAQEYYESPSLAIESDSVQNTLTKLLVATGIIPASAPALDIGF